MPNFMENVTGVKLSIMLVPSNKIIITCSAQDVATVSKLAVLPLGKSHRTFTQGMTYHTPYTITICIKHIIYRLSANTEKPNNTNILTR